MTSEEIYHNFINLTLKETTLDRYYVRTAIVEALKKALPYFKGKFLDVGCGQMPYKSLIQIQITEYIGMDLDVSTIHNTKKADILWDGQVIPLPSASIDTAMATEVFEHCPDIQIVLQEIYRVLKPGGVLFFTVPFLWPLHEVPYDEYRYTPFSLQRHLQQAGFSSIKLSPLGGWDASLAQMIGLWTRRRPMSPLKQKLLSILAKPVIKYLIRKDRKPKHFTESTMITGLTGIVIK